MELNNIMTDKKIGQEILASCGKCKIDTPHLITSVNSDVIEKVMCKVCMSYHRYKAPADEKPSTNKNSAKTATKKTSKKLGVKRNREENYILENPCCDEPLIKEQDGFFVCMNCGMVYDEQVLDASPRRAFTQDEIAKRKSAEPVYSPIGPRTVIQGNTDAKGSLLSPKGKQKYHYV